MLLDRVGKDFYSVSEPQLLIAVCRIPRVYFDGDPLYFLALEMYRLCRLATEQGFSLTDSTHSLQGSNLYSFTRLFIQ